MSRGFHASWWQGTAAERGGFATALLAVPFFWYETDTRYTYQWDGVAWLSIDVGGSGAAGQVAYWAGPSIIAGDAGMTYVPATDTLTVVNMVIGGLGAGAVQSSAAGVISSGPLPLPDLASYTRGYIVRGGAADWEAYSALTDGAALVGDGVDVISTVTPTWLGGHTFMQGMALIGNTGINIVTIKGNAAKGLHVVDNVIGGACEYVTFVTTTLAEEVVFNELGYDLDFRVEAVGVANAFTVDGATGHIGVATVPVAANIFTIQDNAVTTTASFYGARYTITKTAGATDVADVFAAIRARMTIDDNGVTHGGTYGIYFEAVLTDGIIGSIATPRGLIGAAGTAQQVAGTINGVMRGGSFYANQDGGTADDIHGVYIDVDADGTVNNSAYMLYLNERSNIDYGIYQNGAAPHYLGGRLAVGGTVGALAQLHVDQSDNVANIPVLILDQGDVSEQHIVCSINGADQDFPAIIELDVTGTPALWWDESADAFAFTNGLEVGDVVGGNFTHIGTTGDVTFVGGAGLVFGSCYGNHIGWQQAAAVQNTWYNISDADMVSGPLHKVTHDGNGMLTVTEPGMYLVTYSICFQDDAANDHIEAGIEVSSSGSAEVAGQCHLENKFANEEEHMSSSTVLDLADNATLEVCIRTTDAGTPTIDVQAVNLTCAQIGGT